jgi:hypothetical protein
MTKTELFEQICAVALDTCDAAWKIERLAVILVEINQKWQRTEEAAVSPIIGRPAKTDSESGVSIY